MAQRGPRERMASGGRDLGCRVITEDQNRKQQVSCEHIFKHFRINKVDIASAITKPYPFLMILRDHAIISEQMYKHFQDTCANLVPVTRVMYDVLHELEKTFCPSLLKVLFSRANLQAYPGLREILRSFPNAFHEPLDLQRTNGTDVEELSRVALAGQRVPWEIAVQVDEGGESEEMPRLLPYDADENGNNCVEMSETEERPEASSSPASHGPVSCDPEAPQLMNGEAAEEVPSHTPHNEEEEPGELQDRPLNEEESEELTSSPQFHSEQGPEQSEYEAEKCSCVMCCPKISEGPSASTDSSQACDPADTADPGTSSILGKPKRKRRKKKGYNWSRIKTKRPQSKCQKGTQAGTSTMHNRATQKRIQSRGRKRGRYQFSSVLNNRFVRKTGWLKGRKRVNSKPLRKVRKKGFRYLKKTNANFDIPKLPVTCGNVAGTLTKEVFKQGVWKKSIRSEDGSLLSPREFEVAGGRASSKNWKISVRCHGWTLRELMQKEYLPIPPSKKPKKRTLDSDLRNSNECEVCRDGGTLFCCDTCSRAFHEYCHLPLVEVERNPWSCIFCTVGSFKSQEHCQESEILERQMQAEEQLKCEFLLLKVYCCSESSFFAKIPYYYYIKETSEAPKELMWLDKIKTKLTKKEYTQVAGFVQDMRLIFQNHRTSYKYHEFGQMGLRLEAEFEKNFKEVFAIQETNESS
ncbi:nuclear body protein SP140 isoform X1 [Cavia porcellus]|uniref:nuclear body protein SP140 isoform X1 n=2 Tax=Cavia porcellus TaxID=10141 RepID=UPI002FE17EA4